MNQKNLDFTVFLLHQLSSAWHVLPSRVYAILNGSGALYSYIIPCYDVLHTLGREYLIEDITDYVRERGYTV